MMALAVLHLLTGAPVSDRMKLAMGGLEYLDLIGGRHNYIYEFLFCLWLIKDNSLNAGLGFVFSINTEGKDVGSSNSKSASIYLR